jgi:hypothetical protein
MRPFSCPRLSRRRAFLALLGALPAAHGGLGRTGGRPTRWRRIGVLSWAQGIAPTPRGFRSDRGTHPPRQPFLSYRPGRERRRQSGCEI